MDIKKALGARIKELRHKMQYTQEEFAELINVAPRHVSRIENGVNTPSIETLEKIANVFGLELKDLCDFQHLYSQDFLKKSIKNIIETLSTEQLPVAYKVLNSLFR